MISKQLRLKGVSADIAPLTSHALVATNEEDRQNNQTSAKPSAPALWGKENNTPTRIGADCAGVGSGILSIMAACPKSSVVFVSELCNQTQAILNDAFDIPLFRRNAEDIHPSLAKGCDVYIAGFPCQPFSSAGHQRGADDPRTKVIDSILLNIAAAEPSIVILENVSRFCAEKHEEVLAKIVQSLVESYAVQFKVVNSSVLGHPQNRLRWFLVAIRRDKKRKDFQWPEAVPGSQCTSIESLLDPYDDRVDNPQTKPDNDKHRHILQLCQPLMRAPLIRPHMF